MSWRSAVISDEMRGTISMAGIELKFPVDACQVEYKDAGVSKQMID